MLNYSDKILSKIDEKIKNNMDNSNLKLNLKNFRKMILKKKETMNQIYNNIGTFEILSNLIDEYLIPQKHDKKSNAEVSTPFKLRKEMLEKIPVNFWTSIKKVFEPCVGKCGFIVDIIDKFMNGLEEVISDKKERYKTIVEKCLYFGDINPINIFICKTLIDPFDEYKLNYNEGNTLELNIKDKWNITEFDAVIGNPPYNEDPDKTDNSYTKPVYQNWVYKFNEISQMLMFVTPSKWFSSSVKILVKLREYMKSCNIQFINHYPQDDVFKNVKIKGGISYYLINKKFKGPITFNNYIIDINKYDILVEPKYYRLLSKIQKYNEHNLSELYCTQVTFLKSKQEKTLLTSKGDILCYVSKNKGFKKYIQKDQINKKYDYWKIITPAAAFKGTSGFSDIYLLNDKEIHSMSYISFKTKSEQEARSLYSYLKCKLVHVLLSLRKHAHNLCNSKYFIWIPLVPLDKEWDNYKLYKYFNLDKIDIDMIKDLKLEGSYIV